MLRCRLWQRCCWIAIRYAGRLLEGDQRDTELTGAGKTHTSLLTDCDFLPLRELGHFHAKGRAEIILCVAEDVLVLADSAGCHYCLGHQLNIPLALDVAEWSYLWQ